MLRIVQGDNNRKIPIHIGEDITGGTVEVTIEKDDTIIKRPADIINAKNGICQFVLFRSDLTTPGMYQYQWTVKKVDQDIEFSGEPVKFYVYEKIDIDPPTPSEFAIVGTAIVGVALVG